MPVVSDVFFWALVATACLYAGLAVFTSRRRFARGTYIATGIAASLGYAGPRLAIPFLPQPGLGLPAWLALPVGGALTLLGIAVMLRAIQRLRAGGTPRAADAEEPSPVIRDGLYGLVRHPMYLGDVIWPLGLAIAADAVYALLLVPLWWGLREGLAVLEEERLTDKFGAAYERYCDAVQARILPRSKDFLAR